MLADFPLSFAAPEVALFEVLHIGGMDCPVVALAVGASSGLDETVVERQVVPDGIPPTRAS